MSAARQRGGAENAAHTACAHTLGGGGSPVQRDMTERRSLVGGVARPPPHIRTRGEARGGHDIDRLPARSASGTALSQLQLADERDAVAELDGSVARSGGSANALCCRALYRLGRGGEDNLRLAELDLRGASMTPPRREPAPQ